MRLDERLRHEIVAAVQAVEKTSAAEVVVTVVPRSATHWDVALGAALAATLLLQSVVAFFFGDTAAAHVALDSVVLAILVVSLLRGLPALERLLLPSGAAIRRVEAGAESAFCRQGVFRTRSHVGALVYVSLLERRAVFLPDDGVARALPAEALALLRAQAAAIFAGPDPRSALLNLLDHLRRLGAQHLPASADQVNELPDEPVTG